ncbi:MAG: hypothetical protein MZV64_00360 [Ignavibacteriales bacterium]|nr:hypothetical protein [Ignavibacteriales bacterium]
MVGVNDLVLFQFAVQDRQHPARARMLQVVRETVLDGAPLFLRVVRHLRHPEPGFGKFVVVAQ